MKQVPADLRNDAPAPTNVPAPTNDARHGEALGEKGGSKKRGRENWRAEYPFLSHWRPLTTGRIHYLDEGTSEPGGATLLFVHGNPTWSFHWRRLVRDLRNDFRCVAVDHLGCGLSDLAPRPLTLADRIEHLVEFVEGQDLKQITLVAQDWGGAIGLGALQRLPDRFRAIALFNTGAYVPRSIPLRIRVCRWPVVGRLAVQGAGLFSRAALRMTLARTERLPPHVRDGYLAPYATWSRRAAVYQFVCDIPSSPRHPTWRTLEALENGLTRLADLPIMLVWGEKDWCFTPACLERFVDVWPRADVHRLADAGHWIVEDAPDDAQRLLRDFVAAHAPFAPVRRGADHDEL